MLEPTSHDRGCNIGAQRESNHEPRKVATRGWPTPKMPGGLGGASGAPWQTAMSPMFAEEVAGPERWSQTSSQPG